MAWNEVANLKAPGMTYRGTYSAAVAYVPGDVVTYSYASWVAKVPTKGVAPATSGTGATNWGQVAARGATGEQGPQGVAGKDGVWNTDQQIAVFGSTSFTRKPHGSLVWSGPWYNPTANVFTRLRNVSDGRLVIKDNVHGVASVANNNPSLTAPVNGLYELAVAQCWGTDVGAKGAGMGTSLTAGDQGMALWVDTTTRFGITSRVLYLTAGTTLYPWVWNSANTGMSPADRGIVSEYSMTYIGAL